MSALILDAIERRDMFSVFRSAFHATDLEVSQGWEKTKIALLSNLANDARRDEVEECLQACYQDNIRFAQKAISLWALPDEATAGALASALDEFIDSDSPYRVAYPLPLPHDVLASCRVLGVPTAVERDGTRSTIIFAGKRWVNEECELSPENLTLEAQEEYSGLFEIRAKRRISYPVFDCFTIHPERRLVELRIDKAKYENEAEIIKIRTALQEKFNRLARAHCGIERALGDPLNLYSALLPLYKGEGWKVQCIEHANDGGYLNKNKGRHRSSDVREDDYHVAGEEAVPQIHLHSLTACWDLGFGSPKLILHGHSKILSTHAPNIDYAKVLDCWDEGSYMTVLNSLIDSLSAS
ncbi:hypothetical protein [uncultured Azohydromonas sp.]|jgi:hypothetical protein|uniref:hypothetical protein n=1 Tax=uncultured Azohydromonas sp. TaxID=487342 RepID=UPI0026366061|nr:hypothetical protein [uncultured Azohydromonas sp.]